MRSLDLGHLVRYRLDDGPEYDGVMDLAKAAIDRMRIDVGLDVDIESEAPPGSGLGGSSALVTAVVAALACLDERRLTCDEVARTVVRDRTRRPAHRRRLAGPVRGGVRRLQPASSSGATALACSRSTSGPTPSRNSASTCCSATRARVRRNVGLIDRQIAMFESGREDTLLGMKQLREMAYTMRDAIEAGDMPRLGAMLREAFEAKQRMNPHIAEETPIEAMLDAAAAAGATGGKICGAGGGGYLLIATPPEARASVRAALEAMGGQFASFEVDPDGVRARRGDRRWAPVRP